MVHDNNVDLFLEELKNSESKANPNKKTISLESINDFYRKQKKYKELKRREEFFSSCKDRALELISDLDIYIMKYLGSSLKIVEKQKRKQNKKLGKKVDKKVVKTIKSTWEKELEDIKISCEDLRDNVHLLTHSFSSFEEQCRKKLLSAKVVYSQK
ncbi:hypothetical protein [Mycoplasma suis]|uniref:hypothetical protein n=1 Tax=Mycoplasma suis TaxID=57372 RepID=UPI0003056ECC|nr:hypothetical protein [Mycoplasma suis]